MPFKPVQNEICFALALFARLIFLYLSLLSELANQFLRQKLDFDTETLIKTKATKEKLFLWLLLF